MAGNLLTLGRLGAVHVVTAAQMMVVQGRPGMEIDCCGPSRQQKDGKSTLHRFGAESEK
jgi:hypothetical protein